MDEGRGRKNWRLRLCRGFSFHHASVQWTKGEGEKTGGVGCVMVSPFITPEYNGRRAREKKLEV